jgi:SynChlorMet cassette radical SAM/SPASM protein ScmF
LNQAHGAVLDTLYFYLTHACNMQCSHCWLSRQVGSRQRNELGTREIKGIIDQAIPLGLKAIKLTGGEPFLRDDVVEIVCHADRSGLSVRIETNGTLLDEEQARALGEVRNLRHVAVSLDGATAESHALLRQVPSSFSRATKAVQWLVEHGTRVEIICCLHRGNLGEVEAIVQLASELGAYQLKFNPVTKTGRGEEMASRGELLSVEEVIALTQRLETHIVAAGEMPVLISVPIAFRSLNGFRQGNVSECGVLNILGILPAGDVSICGAGEMHQSLVFGNVRQEPLARIWRESSALARVREEISAWPTGLCQRCLVRHYCRFGYCRAGAYEEYASLSAPYPFCQEAYDRGAFPATRLLEARGAGNQGAGLEH